MKNSLKGILKMQVFGVDWAAFIHVLVDTLELLYKFGEAGFTFYGIHGFCKAYSSIWSIILIFKATSSRFLAHVFIYLYNQYIISWIFLGSLFKNLCHGRCPAVPLLASLIWWINYICFVKKTAISHFFKDSQVSTINASWCTLSKYSLEYLSFLQIHSFSENVYIDSRICLVSVVKRE